MVSRLGSFWLAGGLVIARLATRGSVPAAAQSDTASRSLEARKVVEQMRGMSMTAQAAGSRLAPNEERRQNIVKRLRALGPEAIAALTAALGDADVKMRQNAALALLWLGGAYSGDASPPTDIRAALPALIDTTGDGDSHVRAWAAHVIAEMGPAAAPAVPALLRLVRDPEEGPRNNSCMALGRIGPAAREALPILRQALNDPSQNVRRFAQNAIERILQK